MSAWTSGLQIDGNAGTQMYADFRNLKIDGYDLLIVQEALKDGSLPILTDDFDYVPCQSFRFTQPTQTRSLRQRKMES
jgi:hypothetical protein